jgi:phosphoglycerate dehydrogenase-like enzyme
VPAPEPVSILLTGSGMDRMAERLGALQPRPRYLVAPTAAAGEAHLAAADAVITSTRITPAYLTARRTRWLHTVGAGVDQFSLPGLRDAPFVITHKVDASLTPMAEHVMSQVLLFARRCLDFRALQAERRWASHDAWPTSGLIELHGATLGIVGLGGAGLATARRARAFGMRVIGTRRQADARLPHVHALYPPDRLHEMLARSDFVAVLAPLTDATRGLIDEPALRAMKPTAFLINIARGPIVREAAIVRALREGWIAGASLDVFEHEPLPPESPLWEVPNLVITPHRGGVGPFLGEHTTREIAANIRRFLAGRPLHGQVKREDIITTFEAPGH